MIAIHRLLPATILLFAGCTPSAENPAAPDQAPPLMAWTWSAPPAGAVNLHRLLLVGIVRDDPVILAAESLRLPAGRVAILLRQEELLGHPGDRLRAADGSATDLQAPWLECGEKALRQRVFAFFTRYRQAGGRLDYLVLDNEAGLSMWELPRTHLAAILADQRASTLAVELGFSTVEALDDRAAPSYVLGASPDELNVDEKPYMAWNRVLGRMLTEAFNRSIYQPVLALYPQCRAGNYNTFISDRAHPVIDVNGHLVRSEALFGNRACPAFYGLRGLAERTTANGTIYGREPFSVLRYLLNNQRAMSASDPRPLTPWIAYYRWQGDQAYPATLGCTPFWIELVYHLALAGADDFLVFNPQPRDARQQAADWSQESDDLLMEGTLAEVNRRLGGVRRQPLTPQPLAWDASLLATGCRLGDGRVLWRITVPRWSDRVRVEPGGALLSTGSRQGLWYESAAGQTVTFQLEKR